MKWTTEDEQLIDDVNRRGETDVGKTENNMEM